VDRRFNRARYDADQMVAVFAAMLKDAVDLDAMQTNLASAVQRALEPAHVSMWINHRGLGPGLCWFAVVGDITIFRAW